MKLLLQDRLCVTDFPARTGRREGHRCVAADSLFAEVDR